LIRLWETSAGNPFYALELAGALQRRGGTPAPDDPLPIPSTLDELLRERLESLASAAIDVALVVAAVAEPTADVVEAALGAAADTGLAEALDGGRSAPDTDPPTVAACSTCEGRPDRGGARSAPRARDDRAEPRDRLDPRGCSSFGTRARHVCDCRRAR
jgi:hypothetical protein